MKLKEFFKGVGGNRAASNIGINKFRMTLDKEAVKTPHFAMRKVEDILENRPSAMNGLRQLALFTIPQLHFTSSDEKTATFANDWLNLRPELETELFNFTMMWLGVGNAYLEPIYTKVGNNNVLDMLYNVPVPSGIYLNLNAKSDDEYWIIEYPQEVMKIKDQSLRFHLISYVRGSYFWSDNIWGITVPKDNLLQFKFLWSRSPFYGNGLLTSSIDNEDVAEEILKNWALSAKYRSLSKKIIGFYNEDGEGVDYNELDRIKDMFDNLEEEDSLLINKKFQSDDLTFNGTDNMMQNELEFLRKDSGSALTPNYMTAFSQDSSMATASEAKVPFKLSLDAIQNRLKNYLNDIITKSLLECYSFLSDDLELQLGEASLYSQNEEFMNISQLYNMRAATFNELRLAAGLSTVEGGDVWGEEPPLDNTTITKDSTVTEKLKAKSIREKYKKEFNLLAKPKQRENLKIEIKEPDSQENRLKEAVKGLLK
jgi:hypothetical protein